MTEMDAVDTVTVQLLLDPLVSSKKKQALGGYTPVKLNRGIIYCELYPHFCCKLQTNLQM